MKKEVLQFVLLTSFSFIRS